MNKREHLWTIIQEECAEIIVELSLIVKQISKIKRFGLTNYQPSTGNLNWEIVNNEYNDFIAVIELLQEDGIPFTLDRKKIDSKKAKVKEYLEISKQVGTLL